MNIEIEKEWVGQKEMAKKLVSKPAVILMSGVIYPYESKFF